jgi:cytochrome c oxidase subunit 4
MAESPHSAEHEHEHDHAAIFRNVFFALCVLTAISFWVGNSPLMNRPVIGWSLMMAVSCAKALLVISFFMHLRWEANWKYVLTIPASIMSLFLLLMLAPDIGKRSVTANEERQRYSAPQEPDREHVSHPAGAAPEHP